MSKLIHSLLSCFARPKDKNKQVEASQQVTQNLQTIRPAPPPQPMPQQSLLSTKEEKTDPQTQSILSVMQPPSEATATDSSPPTEEVADNSSPTQDPNESHAAQTTTVGTTTQADTAGDQDEITPAPPVEEIRKYVNITQAAEDRKKLFARLRAPPPPPPSVDTGPTSKQDVAADGGSGAETSCLLEGDVQAEPVQ